MFFICDSQIQSEVEWASEQWTSCRWCIGRIQPKVNRWEMLHDINSIILQMLLWMKHSTHSTSFSFPSSCYSPSFLSNFGPFLKAPPPPRVRRGPSQAATVTQMTTRRICHTTSHTAVCVLHIKSVSIYICGLVCWGFMSQTPKHVSSQNASEQVLHVIPHVLRLSVSSLGPLYAEEEVINIIIWSPTEFVIVLLYKEMSSF